MTIENDDLDPEALGALLEQALGALLERCKPGGAWYVAGPNNGDVGATFVRVLHALGVYRHQLIWLKPSLVLGRCDYHYRHEPIFYGWKPGAAHHFIEDRSQDTVHEFDKPSVSKEHPTMKPVDLVARHIENSSKPGWIVGDAFGGSGTTLLAAARTGRVARLVELDPRFADVIRDRWTRWAIEAGVDPGPGALTLERD
jgi:site-specific DNA-methyltransferase (adenine-specific)